MSVDDIFNLKLKQICGEQGNQNVSEKLCFDLGQKGNPNNETVFTIGRSTCCDFCFDSSDLPCLISRRHAQITICEKEVFVTDIQSVNGTYVDDVMLEPNVKMKLNVGSTVTFGCLSLDDAVSPGKIVKQENAPFKFILTGNDLVQMKNKKVRPNGSFCDPCDMKDTSDQDSGIANDSPNPSTSNCEPLQSTPKWSGGSPTSEYQEEREMETLHDSEEKVVPLTVRNLIAFSGCHFKDLQFSSDEKENKNGRRMIASDIPSEPKTTRKRRYTTKFSRRKRQRNQDESCAFYECKVGNNSLRDSTAVISWVQCDSCDKWYHTDCVGCDYNMVRSKKRKFKCGLC